MALRIRLGDFLRCVGLLLCLVAISGGACAAPDPAQDPTGAFKVSDTWTWRMLDADGRTAGHVVAIVIGVDAQSVRIQQRLQGALDRWADTVLDRTGRVVQEGRLPDLSLVRFAPPLLRANWPLVPGKAWQTQSTASAASWRGDLRSEYKVEGWERLTVPAGTFDAIRVSWSTRWENAQRADGAGFPVSESGTYWYAPLVRGFARIDLRDASGAVQRRELTAWHVD